MAMVYYFVILFSAFTFGYYSGLNSRVDETQSIIAELSKTDSAAQSLGFALSVVTEERMHEEGVPLSGASSIERELDRLSRSTHSSDGSNDLSKAFGNDSKGQRFRQAFTADTYAQDLPGAELYSKRFWEGLRNDPENAQADIREMLDRLPSQGYPLERSSLIVNMGNLQVNSSEAKAYALNELTRNIIAARPDPSTAGTQEELNQALSTTWDMMIPISAHSAFMKNVSSPDEALAGTVDGILSQPDAGIRIALVSQFLEIYPTLEGQLRATLGNHDIRLVTGNGQ